MAEPGEIAVPGETASWSARVGEDGFSLRHTQNSLRGAGSGTTD